MTTAIPTTNKDLEVITDVLRQTYTHGHPDFLGITLAELELHDKKNHDYAKGGRPLGNFERVSTILSLYPGLPFNACTMALIYMLKQLDAILWGLSQKIVHKIEGLDGRFADVHVYTKIARCAWRDSQKTPANETKPEIKSEAVFMSTAAPIPLPITLSTQETPLPPIMKDTASYVLCAKCSQAVHDDEMFRFGTHVVCRTCHDELGGIH